MAPHGGAAIKEALTRCWRDLAEVRDSCKASRMGIAAARLGRVCTELDDIQAAMGRAPAPAELVAELATQLANRAAMYATPRMRALVDAINAGKSSDDAIAAEIASGFITGYGACLDDNKNAPASKRGRVKK